MTQGPNPQRATFFTAIVHDNPNKSKRDALQEKVDGYFSAFQENRVHVIYDPTGLEKKGVLLPPKEKSFLKSALKIISYGTIVVPAALLIVKAFLRYGQQITLINPVEELGKNFDIDAQDILQKMQEEGKYRLLSSRTPYNTSKFLVSGLSFLIKCQIPERGNPYLSEQNESIEDSFQNLVRVEETCLSNQLNLLAIPPAKKFLVKDGDKEYFLMAQKQLDYEQEEAIQEYLYLRNAGKLDESLRQLAILIAENKIASVKWSLFPVLQDSANHEGPIKLGIPNPDDLVSGSGKVGFIGTSRGDNRGLIRMCANEKQMDIVIQVAREHGVVLTDEEIKIAKNQRLKELENYENLKAFYQEKGVDKNKPLNFDKNQLELDLEEKDIVLGLDSQEVEVSLGRFLNLFIEHINKEIEKNHKLPLPANRRIYIDFATPPFTKYYELEGSKKFSKEKNPNNSIKETNQILWRHKICQALKDKGYIFSFEDGPLYMIIQA